MDSGGGSSQPTSSTTQTSNIPEYARPYVETMLGATQKQLFDTTTTPEGKTEITGVKGYTPFSTDMNKYFAGFQPLQETAFGAAANLGPAEQLGTATGMAGLAGARALGTQYDPMMAQADTFGGQQAAQYMSPFIQQALAPQLREAQRASDIMGQQNQARAVGQGAFGGSRSALVEAERQRNLGMQMGDITAKGFQTAYEQAANQFNQDAARRMQAQQANIGQQQFGANLGLQGIQQALAASGQLGNLGAQQFGQEKDVIGLQNQLGTQQQQLEQNKINQQIQNYATQQQWAMQQLASMNAMLRGLPLQATSTQSYQAAPSAASQVAGLGLTGYGLSKMAAGGDVKETSAGLGAGALKRVMEEM